MKAGGQGLGAGGRIIQTPTLKHLLLFEICAGAICQKLLYKHSETNEYVNNYPTFLRNLHTSQEKNLRILRIKNAKFSEYSFYMNTNI